MLSFSSLLLSLMLLGSYYSLMLYGMSSATTMFQLSYLFFISCNVDPLRVNMANMISCINIILLTLVGICQCFYWLGML
jgi:hypothetical protein